MTSAEHQVEEAPIAIGEAPEDVRGDSVRVLYRCSTELRHIAAELGAVALATRRVMRLADLGARPPGERDSFPGEGK